MALLRIAASGLLFVPLGRWSIPCLIRYKPLAQKRLFWQEANTLSKFSGPLSLFSLEISSATRRPFTGVPFAKLQRRVVRLSNKVASSIHE